MKLLRIAIVLGLASGALEALEVTRLFEAFAQSDARVLRIEMPAGDLRILESRDRLVDAELILTCAGQIGPCRTVAERVRFGSARFDSIQLLTLDLPDSFQRRIESFRTTGVTDIADTRWGRPATETKQTKRGKRTGWKLAADLRMTVPAYEGLELALGDGNLILEGLQGSVRIRVRSGSVQLTASRAAVGRVDVEVKNGRARLSGTGRGDMAGKQVHWQGPGNDALEIKVGRGSAVVALY